MYASVLQQLLLKQLLTILMNIPAQERPTPTQVVKEKTIEEKIQLLIKVGRFLCLHVHKKKSWILMRAMPCRHICVWARTCLSELNEWIEIALLAFSLCIHSSNRYRQVEAALEEKVVVVSGRYGPQQRTLLHTACAHGQHRIAKLLLRAHSEINAMDCRSITPLQVSLFSCYCNDVILIASG